MATRLPPNLALRHGTWYMAVETVQSNAALHFAYFACETPLLLLVPTLLCGGLGRAHVHASASGSKSSFCCGVEDLFSWNDGILPPHCTP